ncbi:histidine kinase [Actinoplanes subglobosus]|uniref:histidine kinase n=1 Tax=Actinoplanes subglobosus TaxID=1547892 RepID=A0ABV8IY32_9ACTN
MFGAPGAWVALLWSAAAFAALRGYSGVPGMPDGLPPRPAWCWLLAAVAVITGLAASTLVRRRPLTALHLMLLAAVGLVLAVGSDGIPNQPDQSVALFLLPAGIVFARVVIVDPPRAWFAALVSMLAAVPVNAGLRVLLRQPDGFQPTAWLAFAVLPTVVAGLLGFSVRQARDYARRLSEQAAEQAVVAERLRISRELHDHVAHSVGVIAMQAGAAARVMDTQPERAREAMLAIETVSRDTLSGLRRILGGLRETPLQPPPGLADVGELVGAAQAAGVTVDVAWSGERRALAAEVELSAYRIIQESLTNVVRHAGAGLCRVSVDYGPAELAIAVVDDGRGGDTGGGGFGLVGLRERVALVNGTLTAGARPGGGFEVAARIPVSAS